MSLDRLEAELAGTEIGSDPDRWARTAYRVALARSENAVAAGDVEEALRLLDKAGRILSAGRSPLEHGRVLTAAANCHRRLGDPMRSASLFDRAASLIAGRGSAAEQAAAFVNQGLARVESGDPAAALDPLDRALAVLGPGADERSQDDDQDQNHDQDQPDDKEPDDKEPDDNDDGAQADRIRAAALINRAQARQAIGRSDELVSAIDDYRRATTHLDPDAPQTGMALHGIGTTMLELLARGHHDRRATASGPPRIEQAIDAFTDCLRILTANAFPFQHALAQHSLAVAYQRRAAPHDLARACGSLEIAVSIFDPRLHADQWKATMDTLAAIDTQLEGSSPRRTRIDHFLDLLLATEDQTRTGLLRERLLPLSHLPAVRIRIDLDRLAFGLTGLAVTDYQVVLRSLLPVLMELPDGVLEASCAALCAAHRSSDHRQGYDQALDEVIHQLLHGPQRVRVRDLLQAQGWIRP